MRIFCLIFSFCIVLALAQQSSADGIESNFEAQGTSVVEPKAPPSGPPGIEKADSETQAEAVGHYARSRSLLIAAIREFDKASSIAKADAILNSQEWRSDLIERAEDLEHILAPQGRVTRGGVRFEADSRLLNTETKAK